VRGASRTALTAAIERFDATTGGLDATRLARLADELFSVLHVVDSEHILRRGLADPSRPGSSKAEVARVLFEGKISPEALELVSNLVSQRWSRPSEMADGVEELALVAEVARADREGKLDDLEDELFRFGRIVEGQPALRNALGDRAVPAERKVELVSGLLSGRATDSTVRLATEAATHSRGRNPERALAVYSRVVTERRNRLVALVRSAVPLTGAEKDRLAAALAGVYGREIQIKAEVDPSVLGGLTVQVGDEVVDGTIAGRLDRLKRRFER
jgi:F-type H+-transporting ATPase subunit delta